MRLLVISDIHANLVALEAVLAHASGDWDKIWCLGDLVGYGPNPNECVALLRQHEHLSLSGNHDWAVLGRLDAYSFNADARAAIIWTQNVLEEENRSYIEQLPTSQVVPPFTLAHGSPRQPVWEYIMEPQTAMANFDHFATTYCLVGHTHAAVIFEHLDDVTIGVRAPLYSEPLALDDRRLIINPGSVGQPRDGDPRAAYAILDLDRMTWEQRRASYEIEATQQLMRQLDLPDRLVIRLQQGW